MLIPAGFGQINWLFSGTAYPTGAQVTLGYDVPSGGGGPDSEAEFFFTVWRDNILPLQTSDLALTGCMVKHGPNATGPTGIYLATEPGEGPASASPSNCALLVRKITASGAPRFAMLDTIRDFATERLRASDKDRAENLMIVDLIRNDLSRIAQAGSVEVSNLFKVETYPTLHTMVSTVTAKKHADAGVAEILRALFPCGSVTGAPKIAALDLIAALEPVGRGASMGASSGDMCSQDRNRGSSKLHPTT